MRTMISDELWATLGPVVEQTRPHRCGHPSALSDRAFLEALLYWARTGIPWRDLPSDFGDWSAVYNRFRRWVASDHVRALFERLTDNPVFGPVGYRERNRVERLIGKLKPFRRVATRSEKLKLTFHVPGSHSLGIRFYKVKTESRPIR